MPRKICVVTGSRAEYGLIQPTLKAIIAHPMLELSLVVCGMHLSEDFGRTIKEIVADGFKIDGRIESTTPGDTGNAMALSVGTLINELSKCIKKSKPDIFIALTDLGHALATAIIGIYTNIPVAHIHGGDVSGNADESVRHAITKLSHIHFPATSKSGERIIRMGEDAWRVHVVGAPGLDSILKEELASPKVLSSRYRIDLKKPFILAVQHPVTTEVEDAKNQIKETLEALKDVGVFTIFIYPNSDAGGRAMIEVIKKYASKNQIFKTYKSLPHTDYLGLMKYASALIGNSSSGIIESPSFRLPVVNVGTRQEGRERAKNVIDVGYKKEEIKRAIEKAIYDQKFRDVVRKTRNPYGDGKASERIVEVLSSIEINKKLIQKKLTYGYGK
jgi:UDP-N-acetylglucosamine 2-epimerase (non-hydrolysing)/GDP/UDP-N,N'-diacetylbacillosamine 2-epimerase (hydrolysing)